MESLIDTLASEHLSVIDDILRSMELKNLVEVGERLHLFLLVSSV